MSPRRIKEASPVIVMERSRMPRRPHLFTVAQSNSQAPPPAHTDSRCSCCGRAQGRTGGGVKRGPALSPALWREFMSADLSDSSSQRGDSGNSPGMLQRR
ncbi:hypothetical protein EYF80_032184 [Liparis tanakae]|uniref:Uncharacterized protein n=1 Tax=Liparis tanakae TaxID=230148 RepID=A0A4Z2GY45_9TELE|nr:hypothetical protein EYF80_032184 [Liparis tanakae]